MALRSYFNLQPGVPGPGDFSASATPLLTLQELWENARACRPSLLFRVRSQQDAGATLQPGDRLESCVGLVDSTVRWRVVFRSMRDAVAVVQHQELREVCSTGIRLVAGGNPATIPAEHRRQVVEALVALVSAPSEGGAHVFERLIADNLGRLVAADSDVEAAFAVPFVQAMCPFDAEKQRQEFSERMASLETLVGSQLLTEAHSRLCERAPIWLASKMPDLGPSGSEERATIDDED